MSKRQTIIRELHDEAALRRCAAQFRLVGDLTRLKICYLLCHHRELSVGEIAELVGVSVSAVSHTLRKLEEAGAVQRRKDARKVWYRLLPESPLARLVRGYLCVSRAR